ncbi:MAG: TolC family protein [Pirellulales bacterium]
MWVRFIALLLLTAAGCSRAHYRRDADAETYALLQQKIAQTPWAPPGFTIEHDPRSRLFLPTNPDWPRLPPPGPALYNYELPDLPARTSPAAHTSPQASGPEAIPAPGAKAKAEAADPDIELPPPELIDPEATGPTAPEPLPRDGPAGEMRSSRRGGEQIRQASYQAADQELPEDASAGELPVAAIPRRHWEAIEPAYLSRMLELERVREEYVRSYQAPPDEALVDRDRRLSLEDIVALALLNSREYQAQKEVLYRSALALSLERFDYALKFSPLGGGADLGYDHVRSGGPTTGTLAVPSSTQVDRVLAGGGTLLGRFANDVLLTFNGPQGFTSDISSEMFFNFSQAVLQRDVLFEPLTQAERSVVYAARDYARYRKTFFFQLASDYYALIRVYRQIEIESQNYFSLVRALSQAEAEFEAGLRSRIQVEQIEQSMLLGRSRLIATCVGLERSLDRLKLVIGLPPELGVNLDLDELTDLTQGDEAAVSGELVRRTRDRLAAERAKAAPRPLELLNAAVVLTQRMAERILMDGRLEDAGADLDELALLRRRLQLDEARLNVQTDRQVLENELAGGLAPPLRLFQRSMDLAGSLAQVAVRQVELARALEAAADELAVIDEQTRQLQSDAAELRRKLADALAQARLDEVPQLLVEARALLARAEQLVAEADELLRSANGEQPTDGFENTLAQVDQLLAAAEQMLSQPSAGLVPVEIDVDDAMLTALSGRLDLMNERGAVADDRRAVKLAADELRSILNLSATQVINSRHNRPFDFNFENSRTQVGLSLDLPLNRKAQRNLYRRTLIDYHVALRRLVQVEDTIKLGVRDDLRDLALARAQYLISVASAALAAERVASTQLELALGFPGVAARDFLEAQDAFRVALGSVADNHIGYTVNRTRFFLNLELLEVDADGFWRQLRDEQFQPEPQYQLSPRAGPAYGNLPRRLKLSPELRGLHPH